MGKSEWQRVRGGFLKALFEGSNPITVTEKAHISQEKQWNFRVLQNKIQLHAYTVNLKTVLFVLTIIEA